MIKRRRTDLSDLPEFIIQHIQSFLHHGQVFRTSLLFKSWLRAWSTSPTLHFHGSELGPPALPSTFTSTGAVPTNFNNKRNKKSFRRCHQSSRYPAIDPQDSYQLQQEKKQEKFSKMVEDTLLRYQQHRLPIEKLSLAVQITDIISISSVKRWFQITVQSGLRELVLDFCSWSVDESFVLPSWIFSCPTLQTISVSGCQMETPADDQIIKCCSLINLRLHNVRLDDQLIHMLSSNCHLIENINLSLYKGLEKLHFGNLPMLKDLKVYGNYCKVYGLEDTEVFELDSRSLTNLTLYEVAIDKSVRDELYLDCIQTLNLYSCVRFEEVKLGKLHRLKELRISYTRINLGELESHSLRVLKLRRFDIDDQELDKLFCRCPSIEDLSLFDCSDGLTRLKVANLHCLKRVKYSAFGSKSMDIDGPSLRTFCYVYGPWKFEKTIAPNLPPNLPLN